MIQDLKPYPAMKDSGAPWLGEIPGHWQVLPNRAIFTEVKERDHPQEQMLSVTITKGVILQQALLENSSKKDSSKQDKSAYKLVLSGDIAYNKMRAWQGAIGVSDYRGIVSPAYVVQRPRDGTDARYLHYLLRRAYFQLTAKQTTNLASTNSSTLRAFPVVLPPIVEQGAILDGLMSQNMELETAIERTAREITLLREYRTRLITDVVTGKLDVREAAANLPDEVEKPDQFEDVDAIAASDEDSEDTSPDATSEEAEA